MNDQRSPFLRGFFGLVVGLALLIGAMHLVYAGKILPNVKSGSLNLGGRTESDAAEIIATQAQGLDKLTYSYKGQDYEIKAEEIGLKVDARRTAEEAAKVGRQGFWGTLVAPYRVTVTSTDVPLRYELSEGALTNRLKELTADVGTPVKDASIVRQGTTFRIVEEQTGNEPDLRGNVLAARAQIENFETRIPLYVRTKQPDVVAADLTPTRAYADLLASKPLSVTAGGKDFTVEPETISQWVTFNRADSTLQGPVLDANDAIRPLDEYLGVGQDDSPFIPLKRHSLHADLNRETTGLYVAQVADEVDSPPVNARLAFAGGQLQISGAPKDGVVVDRAAAVGAIREGLKNGRRTASLPSSAKLADIRQETLPTLGITTLIGKATTTFGGSPANRTYNIGVGARRFNGTLVKPGEEFSFNAVLGDVGPETGYRPELVIKENKTVPEYGGGLCQVSTTMFRAALDAGLPITDRTNHSYAVHYYAPIGMDATIYPPDPDMKFRNNTKGNILVQTSTAGQSLTYEFYGTDDGRQSRSEIIHINATEEGGGTASFRYIVEGGPDPINRVFSSSYKPRSQFPVGGARSLN